MRLGLHFFKGLLTSVSQQTPGVNPTGFHLAMVWLRQDPCELFAQYASIYPPLWCANDIPDSKGDDDLPALRQHVSSIWSWNRPVYDVLPEPHIRIELRTLPAGPTILDMQANMTAYFGLVLAMRKELDHLLPSLPFEYALQNFYQAARNGLDAELIWPLNLWE